MIDDDLIAFQVGKLFMKIYALSEDDSNKDKLKSYILTLKIILNNSRKTNFKNNNNNVGYSSTNLKPNFTREKFSQGVNGEKFQMRFDPPLPPRLSARKYKRFYTFPEDYWLNYDNSKEDLWNFYEKPIFKYSSPWKNWVRDCSQKIITFTENSSEDLSAVPSFCQFQPQTCCASNFLCPNCDQNCPSCHFSNSCCCNPNQTIRKIDSHPLVPHRSNKNIFFPKHKGYISSTSLNNFYSNLKPTQPSSPPPIPPRIPLRSFLPPKLKIIPPISPRVSFPPKFPPRFYDPSLLTRFRKFKIPRRKKHFWPLFFPCKSFRSFFKKRKTPLYANFSPLTSKNLFKRKFLREAHNIHGELDNIVKDLRHLKVNENIVKRLSNIKLNLIN